MSLKFLGIAGSLRQKSTNKGLLRAAQANLPEGISMEFADLSDIPFYNADLPEKPAPVPILAQIGSADALVLACTEYNYSIAPTLKNILDWASGNPTMRCWQKRRWPSWAPVAGWGRHVHSITCGRFAYSSTFAR